MCKYKVVSWIMKIWRSIVDSFKKYHPTQAGSNNTYEDKKFTQKSGKNCKNIQGENITIISNQNDKY